MLTARHSTRWATDDGGIEASKFKLRHYPGRDGMHDISAGAADASQSGGNDGAGAFYFSTIATARHQPADARSMFTGRQLTVNPVAEISLRLCSSSIWQ